MPDITEIPQTLEAALMAEGEKSLSQVNLLTEETRNLTRAYFISVVNNNGWGNVSPSGINVLRAISVIRLQNGQPVFPWNDEEFINQIIVQLLGILVY